MPSAVVSHSHRATTKVANKAFKSKKSTKGALRELSKGATPSSSSMYFLFQDPKRKPRLVGIMSQRRIGHIYLYPHWTLG